MGLLFLIPILVCGFFFLSKSHFHKHKFQKLDGQQLYLKSALFGIFFTSLAFIFTAWLIEGNRYFLFEIFALKDLKDNLTIYIMNSLYSDNLTLKITKYKETEIYKTISFYIFFTLTFVNSIFLTMVGVKLYKLYYIFKEYIKIMDLTFKTVARVNSFFISINETFPVINKLSAKLLLTYKAHNKGLDSVKKEIKDPLNNLLYSSILLNVSELNKSDDSKLLLLTMSDRKVYIGNILGFGIGDERFSLTSETFIFLPIQSGYRDKLDKSVKLTTSYVNVINNAKDDINEITIILRRDNIISAVKFDEKRFTDIPVISDKEKFKENYKVSNYKVTINSSPTS